MFSSEEEAPTDFISLRSDNCLSRFGASFFLSVASLETSDREKIVLMTLPVI